MSRALDPETAAALKRVDPAAAYREVSGALAATSDGLLEIEILSHGHFPREGQFVLQDGRAVGISKLGLVQAFMLARKQLRDHLDGTALQPDADVFALTAVILMFDPEYLTAANTRKRLLQARISAGGDVRDLIEEELRFVDSLLTSRLHRHTKSPTLWSHRRWLMTMLASRKLEVDVARAIRDVVFVAGERHPRNYYAWCHARFLMGLEGLPADRTAILDAVKAWCFQHHTDISGWSFLAFLLDGERGTGRETACRVFAEILDLVRSLRLANESVWVFLRTVAASGLVGDEQVARYLEVQAAVLAMTKTPADQAVLRAAVEWSESYRHQSGHSMAAG